MKITDLKTAVIRGTVEWTLVRTETDEGISGLGEAYWGVGVRDVIARIRDLIVGEDPLNVDKLYQDMYRRFIAQGSIAGEVVTAISGVELSLWDIAGKALNVPIYSLLGGKYRDRIRIYADCHAGKTYEPAAYAERAKEVKEKGFTALKFDLDVPPYGPDRYNRVLSGAEIRRKVELVAAVREAIGPEMDLAMDCHWRYNTNDAIKLAQALEEFDLLWLEDPVPPENVEAMVRVSGSTRTPICTGENLYTRHGFRELIEKQAVRIIAPDIPKVGGLLESKKIADMADTYYIPLAPHNISSPIATIASCHTCAAIPNFLVLEFHAVDLPWWDELVIADKPIIKDGYIKLSDKPGLGVELNEEEAARHLREGESLF